MSARSLHEQIADLKKAIDAQESLRLMLGDSVLETTLAVLRDQLAEYERQATRQDAANSDTHRDIELLLQDLRKARSDDIEAGLECGRSLDLSRTVVAALGVSRSPLPPAARALSAPPGPFEWLRF